MKEKTLKLQGLTIPRDERYTKDSSQLKISKATTLKDAMPYLTEIAETNNLNLTRKPDLDDAIKILKG